MLEKRWERGMAPDIAQRFGVSADLVVHEAAIVSDILEIAGDDPEALRAEIAAGLRRVEAEAEELRQEALKVELQYGSEGEVIGAKREIAAAVAALGVKVKSLDTRARHRGIGVPQAKTLPGDASSGDPTGELRELLREPPPWLADMLAALGWMRLESK